MLAPTTTRCCRCARGVCYLLVGRRMGRNLHPRPNSRGEPSTIDINDMARFKNEKRVSATLAPTSCIMLPATRLSGPHLRGRQAPCHPQHALLVSPTTYSHRLCCLPNPSSSQDPIYVGGKHRRVHGDAYFELVDEFLMAVKRRYGTSGESNSGRDRVSASCGGGDALAVMSLHPLWLTALLPPFPSLPSADRPGGHRLRRPDEVDQPVPRHLPHVQRLSVRPAHRRAGRCVRCAAARRQAGRPALRAGGRGGVWVLYGFSVVSAGGFNGTALPRPRQFWL